MLNMFILFCFMFILFSFMFILFSCAGWIAGSTAASLWLNVQPTNCAWSSVWTAGPKPRCDSRNLFISSYVSLLDGRRIKIKIRILFREANFRTVRFKNRLTSWIGSNERNDDLRQTYPDDQYIQNSTLNSIQKSVRKSVRLWTRLSLPEPLPPHPNRAKISESQACKQSFFKYRPKSRIYYPRICCSRNSKLCSGFGSRSARSKTCYIQKASFHRSDVKMSEKSKHFLSPAGSVFHFSANFYIFWYLLIEIYRKFANIFGKFRDQSRFAEFCSHLHLRNVQFSETDEIIQVKLLFHSSPYKTCCRAGLFCSLRHRIHPRIFRSLRGREKHNMLQRPVRWSLGPCPHTSGASLLFGDNLPFKSRYKQVVSKRSLSTIDLQLF